MSESKENSPPSKESIEEVKQWSNDIAGQKEITEKMRKHCAFLLDQFFAEADEYAREKFIKDFCEPVSMLYKNLARSEGLETDSVQERIKKRGGLESVSQSMKRVQSRVKQYIERRQRHMTTYLLNVSVD